MSAPDSGSIPELIPKLVPKAAPKANASTKEVTRESSPEPGRILAIDFGEKRVGIALSDPLRITAQMHPYIPNTPNLFKDLAQLIQEKEIRQIVVGLPLNRHGEDTIQTQKVRRFTAILEQKTTVPIAFVDESYSSKEAESHLIAQNVSRKKRVTKTDSMSAVVFLRRYLEGEL